MYIQVHLYIIFSTCSTKINFLLPHSDFTPIFPIYFPPFLIQKLAFIKMPVSKKYMDPWILAMASDPIYIHSCWSVIPMWLYNQQEIKYTTVCLHSCPSATTGSNRFKKQKSSQINVYVLIFQVSEATCISQWHNLLFRVSFFFCSTAAWITFSFAQSNDGKSKDVALRVMGQPPSYNSTCLMDLWPCWCSKEARVRPSPGV